ncbi:unnamed protein product [Triticum turgidum subsp. durum]|uniref:Calcium uniporter protein C-terminal domain-containing protein n=1 Tax=Triticum turgidum subsp. durum TaxID=4567 RepID=A0A9R0TL68_TRITD|nr:unnamed protein product [Triticum turgidum subsp. durum]
MDDAGVLLLFRDKAYLHPEKEETYGGKGEACRKEGRSSAENPSGSYLRVIDDPTIYLRVTDDPISYVRGAGVVQVVDLVRRAVPLALEVEDDPRREELRQLQEKKDGIDKLAHRQVRRILWSGLGLIMSQIGLFFRLTFWELSWDVMEPIAFFTTASGLLVSYTYFLVTSRDPTYQDFMERLFLSRRRKLCAKHRFDMERYLELHRLCKCPLEGHYPHGPKLHNL